MKTLDPNIKWPSDHVRMGIDRKATDTNTWCALFTIRVDARITDLGNNSDEMNAIIECHRINASKIMCSTLNEAPILMLQEIIELANKSPMELETFRKITCGLEVLKSMLHGCPKPKYTIHYDNDSNNPT